MGLKSNFKTATRSLTRRKTKNASAIFAITLGVTLLVGVQITTETLKETFLTSLLTSQGEIDISISNGTGKYLSSANYQNISKYIPDAKGIMPELTIRRPVAIGSQFEPYAEITGVPLSFPEVFGNYYDWKTGEIMDLNESLIDNISVLLSSELAMNMDLSKNVKLPLILETKFTNLTLIPVINETTGLPVINEETLEPSFVTEFSEIPVNLSVVGIYNSNIPGIGSRRSSSIGGLIMRLDYLQVYASWQNVMHQFVDSTDIVDSYLVAFKTDHFSSEIDRKFLQTQFDNLKEKIPLVQDKYDNGTAKFDEVTGLPIFKPIYSIYSARLTFFEVADIMFDMMNMFLNTLGILIVTTGLLLITNIQLMSVEDREFQTGVLRAVGEKRRGIFQSYLIETVFQGIVGGLLGLVGGLIFGWGIAFYLGSLFGTGEFSVKPVIKSSFIVLSVVIGIILAVITGILPSIRAARVNIVEALRGIKTSFEEKSSRNYAFIGLIIAIFGLIILLQNSDPFWEFKAGYDSILEWENILLGTGFFFGGLGIVLTYYIDRVKALNITAIFLWGVPIFTFLEGLNWIEPGSSSGGSGTNILLFAVLEIILGSVLLVGLNLSLIMKSLRSILIRFKRLEGVAQIAPSLISSHKTRSTLTFAIFAVVLTLNVLIASLVATQNNATLGQAEEDARGVDLVVSLSEPGNKSVPYENELKKLDNRIEDVIPFRTCEFCFGSLNLFPTNNPNDPNFDPNIDYLPLKLAEVGPEQIRGDAKDASDKNWRYDFYLSLHPDGIRQKARFDLSEEEELALSRESWDTFFDPNYRMNAYNITGFGSFGGFGGSNLDDYEVITFENGTNVTNPIVFTDSFIVPIGSQIWIPMRTEFGGIPQYKTFTVGGRTDFRAGGFPLGPPDMTTGGGGGSGVLGTILMPNFWSNQTNFFGNAGDPSPFSTDPEEYDSFLLKTSLPIADPKIKEIAQKIEDFTNTKNSGYRQLSGNNFRTASAITIYSGIEESLEAANQMVSFLQIYVSFGLVIGAVGMGVISVRNVAERKREIGMMRAIGFPRSQVILSVLLELLVLGLIGLIIGVTNGLLINYGLVNLTNGVVVIPWGTIAVYLGFITMVALIAGALPGYTAARIPPSEALRYVG
ncbi:MAG: FtsX-like permease family protein [Candidatus Hodarchaeales archaeon]|jgi:ABC-type antimicrobial peptide transport system permease subunit